MRTMAGSTVNSFVPKRRSGVKDPNAIIVNVNSKLDKLVGQTNDGSKLRFFAH